MNIVKLTSNAKIPSKGSPKSAGYDLYTVEEYELKPGERKLFKTGLSIAINTGLYGRIAPRSGLALKNGIDVMAGVVDCFSEQCIIKTVNGDKNINELKINDVVLSMNEKLEIEKDFIVAIVYSGENEILTIETDDGILEVTKGTFVYTETGIKTAETLTENEKILHF